MKFRKKPVVIEAVQLTYANWNEICEFAGVGALEDGKPQGTDCGMGGKKFKVEGPGLLIPTKEGVMIADPNDWIIKGIKGEFYPCKPDIFDLTYEKVIE